MAHQDNFAEIAATIDEWVESGVVPGAAICVRFQGEIVAEHVTGEAQPGAPVDERTLFGLASVTKPITAATVVSCVEDGLFALDEPVARFLPEFVSEVDRDLPTYDPALEALRETITIRQLLCHLSGLPEDLPTGYLNMKTLPSLDAYIDAMQRQPLVTTPGTEVRYSNAGYAILPRLVERVTGSDFWLETDRRIIEPLGVRDIVARPGPAIAGRIAEVQDASRAGSPAESYNSAWWRDTAIPWGGLYGSPRDLAAFAEAFLPGRESLLSTTASRAMITDQVEGRPGGVGSLRVWWEPAFWGLGWEVKGTKQRHWTGNLTSDATFCHFGAAGTLLWADPERDLAVAVFANRTVIHRWPFTPPRWAPLCDALVTAADNAR